MASKNWQWVVEALFELQHPVEIEKWRLRHDAGDPEASKFFEWHCIREHQFIAMKNGGMTDEPKLRRRQRHKKSVRNRPQPPTKDWAVLNKAMTPRLIHECLPVLIRIVNVDGRGLRYGYNVPVPMFTECILHWRLRNVHTEETIPGNLVTE